MKQILKASAIVGSGSAVNIIAGIIKSKMMAILLGPSGIGLFGLLYSIQNTATTITGMGFSNSGVRQTAEAHADGSDLSLAVTRKLLWVSSVCSGLLGSLVIAVFREPIARMALGNSKYAAAIALSGIAVAAATVSGSQVAFLNGLHRLGDLARTNIVSSLISMVAAVISVWLWREQGIVIAVVSTPFASLAASAWYSSRIKTVEVKLSWKTISESLQKMFGLGFVFMATALMTAGTQFGVRVIISKSLGIAAAGHFQAAWSISTLYLGFLLGAMATDYYPRLAGVAKDRNATNKMANEQAETALLLAGPIISGMLTLAPVVVGLLYSHAFDDTVSVLRWQVLGDLFKVASWPMAFILLVQERSLVYFFIELSWNFLYLVMMWFGLKYWGLEAAGVAFFISYFCYFGLLWACVYHLNNFALSRKNLLITAGLATCFILIFLFVRILHSVYPMISGLVMTALCAGYSAARLSNHIKRSNDTAVAKRNL